MTQPFKKHFFRLTALSLFIPVLLSSCSKPAKVEPEPITPFQYELKDVRYFFKAGDRVDTVAVQLKGLSVQNPTNTLSTQQIEGGFNELVKTSQFEVDQVNALPKEIELSQFEVRVPQHWYGSDSFDYYEDKFSLSLTQQQKPYRDYEKQVVTVKIPPKSKIDISRQIDAYQLECSFQGILENKTTGQRYTLSGKWKGLLQYNNPSTTLKQYPLQ